MKRNRSLWVFVMLFALVSPAWAETGIISSGTCGENVTWTLNQWNHLTVSGTGPMDSWMTVDPPWGREIQSVTIEPGVSSIGAFAFNNCGNLQRVSIPSTVRCLEACCFANCAALPRIDLPNGVEEIQIGVFMNCQALTEITLPQSVVSFDPSAFLTYQGVSSLRNIHVDAANPVYREIDGVLFERDSQTLVRFPPGRTGAYSVPEGTVRIGNSAFLHSGVGEVILPEGVAAIDDRAFQESKSLTALVLPESLISIGYQAFHSCGIRDWVIPRAVKTIGDYAFSGSACETVVFSGKPDEIGPNAFFIANRTIRAYYDSMDGWTEEELLGYGGSIIWEDTSVHIPSAVQIENRIPPTCGAEGSQDEVVYCAVCGVEIRRVRKTLEKAPHDWMAPVYVWGEGNRTLTATRVCRNDPNHFETETVAVSAVISLQPTCTQRGRTTYIAALTQPGFSTQAKALVDIPPLGHDWGDVSYACSDDFGTVTAQRVCRRDGSHVETETVNTAFALAQPPTDGGMGKTAFIASFENEAFPAWEAIREDIPALKDLALLTLPAQLKTVEAEACMGLPCEGIIVPDGCARIDSRAFADCQNLIYLRMPATVRDIAADAFEGCERVRIDWADANEPF